MPNVSGMFLRSIARTHLFRRAMSSGTPAPVPANQSVTGPAISSIKTRLVQSFPQASHMAIYNDSYQHVGHEGVASSPNKTESHIRIELVSDEFTGVKLPMRHRMVYKVIQEDMDKYQIHAVQLKTKTSKEIGK